MHAILNASAFLDLQAVVIDGVMPPHLIAELVDMVSRQIKRAGVPGIFIPHIYSGMIGADAVSRGGAILPFYSEFAPNKSILLKGGVPARVSI